MVWADILLIATQLAKYPNVLYAKPLNKVYMLPWTKIYNHFFYNNSPWEKESIRNMIVEGESLSLGKIEVYLIVRTCDGFASFH